MIYNKNYRIHLFGDYYLIKPDKLNYAIALRRIVKKSKRETFDIYGYYTTLDQIYVAVKRLYTEEMLMLSLHNDKVEKLLDELKQLSDVVKEKMNESN